MNTQFKKIVVLILVATMALMSVGCYGSFNLTKKVYNWNGSMDNKWVKELVFLVCCALPVYEIAGGIDAVILNSLEFWTGTNPMASTVKTEDGTTVAFNKETNEMTVSYAGTSFVVSRAEGKSTVKNADGKILAVAVNNADGSMSLQDADGNVLSTYSQAEVNNLLANK